jgi:hypothetical protein
LLVILAQRVSMMFPASKAFKQLSIDPKLDGAFEIGCSTAGWGRVGFEIDNINATIFEGD